MDNYIADREPVLQTQKIVTVKYRWLIDTKLKLVMKKREYFKKLQGQLL